ncbi:MAG TPA: TPM domain-containing protein [Tepidisphaeraceae bacterium]|nr:TPM domain-containing protein [Tepidisphaeraceae bacterium]
MHRIQLLLIVLLSPLMLLLGSSRAVAASNGVRDEAHFFSARAISEAEQTIRQIEQRHHKDVLVETLPEVPSDLRDQFQQEGRDQFFQKWTNQRATSNGVNGVYILITKKPGHLQVWVGNETQQRLFTSSDREELDRQLAGDFRASRFDQGLVQGVRFVERQMDTHGTGSAGRSGATVPPAGRFPQPNVPPGGPGTSWGIGGLACVIIGIVLFIMLIRGIFGRSGRGYYGGPGYPPQGGYPQAGYPPQGGYGYGGGGGFGRGFLGGLLGGALGGYAADRWLGHGQQSQGGYVPPPSQGGADFGSGVDTSGTSTGADFGDSSGGGGADFGSSGGADFGGGDSGGGGGDFGGGDAGGSSGGDF